MIRKVVILSLFLLIFPASLSLAKTTDTIFPTSNEVQGEYICESGSEIIPLATCTGNGGVARINALSDGGISWNVDPKWSTIYYFSGVITVTNAFLGTVEDTIPVSCSGVFGSQCGGEVYPDTQYSGVPYIATLTGEAWDASGLIRWIVPPCSISFLSK